MYVKLWSSVALNFVGLITHENRSTCCNHENIKSKWKSRILELRVTGVFISRTDCFSNPRKFGSGVIAKRESLEIYAPAKHKAGARWAQKADSINSSHVQYIKHWWRGWLWHFFLITFLLCVSIPKPRLFLSVYLKTPEDRKIEFYHNRNGKTREKSWMINS